VRILAFSDLHGDGFLGVAGLVAAHRPDWIVLCGDLLPDFTNLRPHLRLGAQQRFWHRHRGLFLRDGAVTTYVVGNHEVEGFRDAALGAVPELAGGIVRVEGIPGDAGPFSFARGWPAAALKDELEAQLRAHPEPSVYVSHAPPYGSLDQTRSGRNLGHRPLFEHLMSRGWPPALVLCGHVHQSFGMERQGDTTIVNMATGYAALDWDGVQASLVGMGRLSQGGSFYDAPPLDPPVEG